MAQNQLKVLALYPTLLLGNNMHIVLPVVGAVMIFMLAAIAITMA
jgi:hypothetical protein